MTTITPSPRPLIFWESGGSVVMRMANGCFAITEENQVDLLELFDVEKDTARANGAEEAWLAALDKAHQLTEARIAAGKWARASGCVSDLGRRNAA